ncbi:hypothetical protein D1AOALGA4SA_6145 [Olavius algarvensis Delta 1 endosymbiont]|nr:hypothetical protein D1AOALGA4SA_6145 [Olavius algarvensis Delta 1 endosymbiont]
MVFKLFLPEPISSATHDIKKQALRTRVAIYYSTIAMTRFDLCQLFVVFTGANQQV